MTPDKSIIAAAEFTRKDLGESGTNYPHIRTMLAFVEAAIDQAKSAPAEVAQGEATVKECLTVEPVQGEAVEYQQLSRYGNWDRIDKATFDLGKLGQTPGRFRALYTAPPSPDAELVELLRDAGLLIDLLRSEKTIRGDGNPQGMTVSKCEDVQARIDAKLATL